jgi:hypothetical protein
MIRACIIYEVIDAQCDVIVCFLGGGFGIATGCGLDDRGFAVRL